MTTIQSTLLTDADAGMITVETVSYRQFIDLLIARALQLHGRGDVMTVEYETDMLKRGKLRAAASKAFPNGLRHVVRKVVSVNYDYDRKVQNRTDGAEQAKGGPTWQRAITVNSRHTPLTAHKDDYDGTDFAPDARVYLRYEGMTDAQRAAGFGKKDFSRYETTNDGKTVEVSRDAVAPFFFNRPKQTVEHRTLTLRSVLNIKMGGKFYHIRQK